MGLLLNLLLRLSSLYFLGETLFLPDDPRFVGKALPIRNLIIIGSLTLVFPLLFFFKRIWKSYPVWIDNLYLSIFWLDMAGNSFNLYDSYFYFDLLPHFHGTASLGIVLTAAFRLNPVSSIGIANITHTLLEIQEYYTDVLLGTHNIRGTFDVVNDLAVGILGSFIYMLIYLCLTRKLKFKTIV